MSEMIYSLIFTCIYVVLCDFYASVFSGKKRQNGKWFGRCYLLSG